MKIKYIWGDLLEAEQKVIVHGCNAQGVMGSGVALAVKNKYPEAFRMYRNNSRHLGDTGSYEYKNRIVVNAITQEFYGRDGKRYVSYDALAEAMRTLNIKYLKLGEIAMPLIGCSLGGGDWNVASAIIESECTHVQPYVYIFDQQWKFLTEKED